MVELSREFRQRYIHRAHPYYDSRQPYHNWSHVQDVLHSTELIMKHATEPKLRINEDLLMIAAAWHDADHHKPIDDDRTKEERSASIARLNLFELSQRQRSIIANSIIDTAAEKTERSTLLGRVLFLTDKGYLAFNQQGFERRLQLIHTEDGHSSWAETVSRTKALGEQVINEARKTLADVTTTQVASLWIGHIEKNLKSLDEPRNEIIL